MNRQLQYDVSRNEKQLDSLIPNFQIPKVIVPKRSQYRTLSKVIPLEHRGHQVPIFGIDHRYMSFFDHVNTWLEPSRFLVRHSSKLIDFDLSLFEVRVEALTSRVFVKLRLNELHFVPDSVLSLELKFRNLHTSLQVCHQIFNISLRHKFIRI